MGKSKSPAVLGARFDVFFGNRQVRSWTKNEDDPKKKHFRVGIPVLLKPGGAFDEVFEEIFSKSPIVIHVPHFKSEALEYHDCILVEFVMRAAPGNRVEVELTFAYRIKKKVKAKPELANSFPRKVMTWEDVPNFIALASKVVETQTEVKRLENEIQELLAQEDL